jgi:hypothetical protein
MHVFANRAGGGVVVLVGGSCMPTLMARECVRAVDWRPRTKGEDEAGWQRERDSMGVVAI